MTGRRRNDKQIEIIDLFAGPGGLGEGFSSYQAADGSHPFRIALSIEKDSLAHRTLELRAFYRQFRSREVPGDYWAFVRTDINRATLFERHPQEAAAAALEARCFELGPRYREDLRALIAEKDLVADRTVVIGGPPCQAYSVAGRSRNGAKADWSLETDDRSTLYEEYLQVLADVGPAAFVMENVRGLLSARMNGGLVISRILSDLHAPARAFGSVRGQRYRLVALSPPAVRSQFDLAPASFSPTDFLIRAEEHGVPQARHRVIIVGLREDLFPDAARDPHLTTSTRRRTVRQAFRDLPPLRSGVSGDRDDGPNFVTVVSSALKSKWFTEIKDSQVRAAIKTAVSALRSSDLDRGGEFVPGHRSGIPAKGFLNHQSRGHMAGDLHRYLFAASWAAVHDVSPTLVDFPTLLLPDHANVDRALAGGQFADRFRVQTWGQCSTTVVSHISKDGHYYIHPDPSQCRSLTVREAARLQSFPDDYLFCGPRTSQFHQVGNAVPVELARRIAGALHQVLR